MPAKSNADLSLFLDILLKLEKHNISYVVIGGFAATIYGITRTTIELFTKEYPPPRYYADPHQIKIQ